VRSVDHRPEERGKANRIRLRHQAASFVDAFETRLDEQCIDEGEDLSIIACGPEVPEAMRAAWILRQEYGYTARILNMHTLKPIDADAIIRAARETGAIITAEEHQIGALAGRVSSVVTQSPQLYGHAVMVAAIGIKDRFGDSGAPWELVKELEVSAEHIAVKAVELMAHKIEATATATARIW
jgi:transketolase